VKRILLVGTLGVAACAVVAAWQAPLVAQTTPATEAKPETAPHLIISPHSAEQCLAALDAVLAMPEGEKDLARWQWGCLAGDHTGYMMAIGASAADALKLVPELVRPQAKAVKLNRFTADQIKAFHTQTE
jgi:hypothetical protein